MNSDLYELIAQIARYVFAAWMFLIALRAVRGVLVDYRHSEKLRRLLPMTGQCGELVVLKGGERAIEGMRYPVIREGSIGSSRRCDVRVRNSSVRRVHAYFIQRDGGLAVRTHAGSKLRDAKKRAVRELLLMDGARFWVGNVQLLLVLNLPEPPVEKLHVRKKRLERDYDNFETGEDDYDSDGEEDDALFNTDGFYDEPIETTPQRPQRRPDLGWGDVRRKDVNDYGRDYEYKGR